MTTIEELYATITNEHSGHAFVVRTHAVDEVTNNLALYAKEKTDVFFELHSQVGIDDVRELRHKGLLRVDQTRGGIILLGTKALGGEAQNALLKILEEPAPSVRFVLVVTPFTFLFETLLSRVRVISFSTHNDTKNADAFLEKNLAQRLSWIEKQRTKGILEDATRHYEVTHLIALCLERLRKTKDTANASSLSDCLSALEDLQHQGSSPKMWLEHLALTLPIVHNEGNTLIS